MAGAVTRGRPSGAGLSHGRCNWFDLSDSPFTFHFENVHVAFSTPCFRMTLCSGARSRPQDVCSWPACVDRSPDRSTQCLLVPSCPLFKLSSSCSFHSKPVVSLPDTGICPAQHLMVGLVAGCAWPALPCIAPGGEQGSCPAEAFVGGAVPSCSGPGACCPDRPDVVCGAEAWNQQCANMSVRATVRASCCLCTHVHMCGPAHTSVCARGWGLFVHMWREWAWLVAAKLETSSLVRTQLPASERVAALGQPPGLASD